MDTVKKINSIPIIFFKKCYFLLLFFVCCLTSQMLFNCCLIIQFSMAPLEFNFFCKKLYYILLMLAPTNKKIY